MLPCWVLPFYAKQRIRSHFPSHALFQLGYVYEWVSLKRETVSPVSKSGGHAAYGKPLKGWTSGEQSLAGLEALGGSAVETAVRESLEIHIASMAKSMF